MCRVLKVKSYLKNAALTGTGIPPGTPIFVDQSLCKYENFYGPNTRNFDRVKLSNRSGFRKARVE